MTQVWTDCPHCRRLRPVLSLSDEAWAGIVRSGPSKAKAVGEIVSLGEGSRADAEAFIDHLRVCIYSWRFSEDEQAVLKVIDSAFSDSVKPEHFTNFEHCSECREHDDTLRGRTRETITRDDLGNPGWSPLSFSSDQGIAYYFPALARFALGPALWPSRDDFAGMLVWHLQYKGKLNRLLAHCNGRQIEAVAGLIELLILRQPLYGGANPELAQAAAIWKPPGD